VNDVIIHDTPNFLTQNPTVASHAITVPDPDKPGQLLHLPLALDGVTSYLPVRKPTADEFRSGNFARIDLTSQHLTWDPSDPNFATQESNTMDKDGEIYNRNPTPDQTLVISSMSSLAVDTADITDDENLASILESNVFVSVASMKTTGAVKTSRASPIDHETLSKRWSISRERAKATVKQTTQRGVRTCLHPSLTKR